MSTTITFVLRQVRIGVAMGAFSVMMLLIFLLISDASQAQEGKIHRNEFGINALPFIHQFFNVSLTEHSNYYDPGYSFHYRRYLKHGNLRFAIGGEYDYQDLSPRVEAAPNTYKWIRYVLYSRLGWEFTNEISKRWQVFYGLDFRYVNDYFRHDGVDEDDIEYHNGTLRKDENYGIAPLLGFRFKLNDRLSLTTEANYLFNWQYENETDFSLPVSPQFPDLPDQPEPEERTFDMDFFVPMFVTIHIRL